MNIEGLIKSIKINEGIEPEDGMMWRTVEIEIYKDGSPTGKTQPVLVLANIPQEAIGKRVEYSSRIPTPWEPDIRSEYQLRIDGIGNYKGEF